MTLISPFDGAQYEAIQWIPAEGVEGLQQWLGEYAPGATVNADEPTALIAMADGTILLPPGHVLTVDADGHLERMGEAAFLRFFQLDAYPPVQGGDDGYESAYPGLPKGFVPK